MQLESLTAWGFESGCKASAGLEQIQNCRLATEVTTASSACREEVLAEWDGGVELVIDEHD